MLATAGEDSTIRVRDLSLGSSTCLSGHAAAVNSVSWSPDGETLATASSSDQTSRIWKLASGQCILTIREDSSTPVTCIKFSPDGRTVAIASGLWKRGLKVAPEAYSTNNVSIWNLAEGQCCAILRGSPGDVLKPIYFHFAAFNPDGLSLVTVGTDICIRSLESGDVKMTVRMDQPANAVALSPRGWLLATAHQDTFIHIWDLSSGKIITTLKVGPGS